MHFHHRVLTGAQSPNPFGAAACALLEASERVLGAQATAGERFHWITKVLDGVRSEAGSVAVLRVCCFERLFRSSAENSHQQR